MKFMFMHRTNAHWESGASPSMDLVRKVGVMVGEVVRSGRLVAADGLRASSQGARLNFVNGKRTVTKGPLVGNNELIAGFAVMKVGSLDEAIEWSTKFAHAYGDIEIDIRPATEPWDIGLGAKPEGLTTRRYIAMHKATAQSEAGTPPTEAQMRGVGALMEEMTKAGVLLSTAGIAPSRTAVRLRNFGGKKTVVDGPFAESKELVGGFAVIDLDSKAAAIDWAMRYADVLGDIELDILQVQG
jgi:hypothetical protein